MLKRIDVGDLRVGMFIHSFCGSWMDHPFFQSRFILEKPRDLQRILDSKVTEVWIDTELSRLPAKTMPVEALADAPASKPVLPVVTPVVDWEHALARPNPTTLDEELVTACAIRERAKQVVTEIFQDARMGRAIHMDYAAELIEDISSSILRNADALVSLARLKTADEYTYMHSVAVCTLMVALALRLGLSHDEVHEAGLSGLLHDIGKIAIPEAILNKPSALTAEEMAVVRQHPEAGWNILRKTCGVECGTVLDVCVHHHEKMDGTGYPYGLAGDQISLSARMGAICDVYDAITSNRVYHQGWEPVEAMRRMATWKGHFDKRLFHAFVKSVGIYPTGSLVRLASDRLAVVLEQHEGTLLTPRVKIFFSIPLHRQIPQKVLDLADPAVKDKIVSRESARSWGFRNLDQLWLGDLGNAKAYSARTGTDE